MKRRRRTMLLVSICVLVVALGAVWSYNRVITNKKPGSPTPFGKLGYTGQNTTVTYRFPGEFEKQQAIWMQWPSSVYEQPGRPVAPTMIKIMMSFAPHIRVNVAVTGNDEIAAIRNSLRSSGYTGNNIFFYIVNHLSIWTRDVGPIFVKDNQNRLSVVDFGFNNYSRDGDPYYIQTENGVDRGVAKLFGLPVIKTSLISEGGAIESNGKGTLMVPEAVALKRNPGMTKLQIENEYKRALGLKKVIWLKKGLAEDDSITSGHINEFCRFANANTILLAQILPGDRYANNYAKESYLRMEENYNILKNATDQDGKPFKIIRVPMPPTLYNVTGSNGTLPVRSYLNYAITNGAVLMQTYWKAGRSNTLKETEAGVKEILKGVFPGREVIGIDAENINLWGGGIHCITQHMPAQ